MQSSYAEAFERDTAGTEAEWLQRLPRACAAHPVTLAERSARIAIDGGHLVLHWTPLPARRIALMSFERMAVQFRFEGVDSAARLRFMKFFDLYMQRGGG